MITLLTDHPAWTSEPGGATARLVPDGTALWYARWDGSGLEWQAVGAAPGSAPGIRRTPADDLPQRAPAALLQALSGLGTVERVANPWLWDAITAALLRRVVRAAQARRLYHRWCAAYGTRHDTPAGPLATAPGPETVPGLAGESPYREVGALSRHRHDVPMPMPIDHVLTLPRS
ncbi:hypothetical protein CUT44_15925 [Streptomyces carminius]|uniref:Uncharacterized protein n=1 Tax=Streptomyces carminius TaxID=2665496 RepID=A0A2M8LXV7_9ACTN|nr:hypothetical protein [Streptomyces carminius]PJE96807.1 hypothetical protein CUT44_15925 [Streptomyces carminius]